MANMNNYKQFYQTQTQIRVSHFIASLHLPEAVFQRCSVKKVFCKEGAKVSQNLHKTTCEFCDIFKNTFFIEHFWWLTRPKINLL